MTHIELRDLLLDRIGWKDDSRYNVDATNQTSESGRYFQDEAHFVSLTNIKESMEQVDAEDDEFNAFLRDLTRKAVTLVLSDVFRVSNIDDEVLTDQENLFDNAISKRMAIIVGELIWTSTRSNRTVSLGKENLNKIFLELNGNQQNPNMPIYDGIRARYNREIMELKDGLNQVNALDCFTVKSLDLTNGEDYIELV